MADYSNIHMENKPIILCREVSGYTPALWSAIGELIGVICPTQSGVVNIAEQVDKLLADYYRNGTLLPKETNTSFGWAASYLDLHINYTPDGQSEKARLTWVRMYR